MRILIIKLGASGDVLRTTTLLNILDGQLHWVTSDNNMILLKDNQKIEKCIPWSEVAILKRSEYNLVINLEDSFETARLLKEIKFNELFGAYINRNYKLTYTETSKEWFDISIISNFGKKRADELKLKNRKTYQELIFNGLGYTFNGEKYFLPEPINTNLKGDIGIAPKSSDVWPMKNWAYYNELKQSLKNNGFIVNFLPIRDSLLKHIGDIQNHQYLISGDSLPMHIALGTATKCLTVFNCTSPWEIFDYGVQKKIISPLLEKYFYRRDFDLKATTSIPLETIYEKVLEDMN